MFTTVRTSGSERAHNNINNVYSIKGAMKACTQHPFKQLVSTQGPTPPAPSPPPPSPHKKKGEGQGWSARCFVFTLAVFESAGLAVELAALGAAERQERLELLVRKLASDVVGEDLPGDVELLELRAQTFENMSRTFELTPFSEISERMPAPKQKRESRLLRRSGMDSLSGVEFRNRLQQEWKPRTSPTTHSIRRHAQCTCLHAVG